MTAPALPARRAIPALNFATMPHRGVSPRAQAVETERVWSPHTEADQPANHGPQGYAERQKHGSEHQGKQEPGHRGVPRRPGTATFPENAAEVVVATILSLFGNIVV